MKIKSKLIWMLFLVCFLFPCVCAQVTVVKQDGNKIYLDTSEYNRQVSVGNSVKIILSKEKLTNPNTGKELGLINHYSEEGKIIEVQPLYAVAQMPTKQTYTPGQEAVIEATVVLPTAPSAVATTAEEERPAPASNRKINTYTVLEREVMSAVKTNLTPSPNEDIAILDTKGSVVLYQVDGNSLQEKASYKLATGYRPVTLSALDVMGTGYAQLFVAAYQENNQRIVTLVFDVQNQEFVQKDTLPYFVKELGCAAEKKIYAQKPFTSGVKPGDIHELSYDEKNQFKLKKETFSARHNWLTGINRYEIQNAETENIIYTANNGVLRMRLKNGKYIESPDVFATTPNRIKYKQKIISFYPSIQVYGPKGQASLAAIQNTTKYGLLSEQFGQYSGGKLHFLHYDNGTLKIEETLPLSGFAYDTNCTDRGILVPQILSSEQTVLTEIYR